MKYKNNKNEYFKIIDGIVVNPNEYIISEKIKIFTYKQKNKKWVYGLYINYPDLYISMPILDESSFTFETEKEVLLYAKETIYRTLRLHSISTDFEINIDTKNSKKAGFL